MPGAGRTRRALCAKKEKRTQVSTGKADTTGIPCAMALRLAPRSPWCPGFLATIAPGILTRDLIPASGDQDHTA